jgi:hypothetical protein
MARTESDREDLLREATALVDRVELRVVGQCEPVTAGFRRDGSLSIFFGSDPVYQFNAAGQLRRAFVDGLLYKADQGRLVSLRRERTAAQVVLQRTELEVAVTAQFLQTMRDRLSRLLAALDRGDFELVGEVSAGGNTLSRVRTRLADLPTNQPLATRPNVGE